MNAEKHNDFSREKTMQHFTAIIERCPDTRLFTGYIPGFPGAHSQGESIDELSRNLQEVVDMLLNLQGSVLTLQY